MVSMSQSAIQQMYNINKTELFISIDTGLCADYKYILSLSPRDCAKYIQYLIDDTQIQLMLDSLHIDILQNIRIDYKKSIISNKFYVESNTIARKVCRCGLSFS